MQAFTELIAATPLLAFVLVALVYVIGDLVGTWSKAWVPSVFVMAALFLAGYWTFFPADIVTVSGMKGIAVYPCMFLLLVHMGTSINLRELAKQWKIIAVTLAGLAGMCLVGWFVGGLFISRDNLIAGLPPLTGGIIAATTMQSAASAAAEAAAGTAREASLTAASVLAIAMYAVQGFFGYPLTAVALKKEGRSLLAEYRSGKVRQVAAAEEKPRKKLIPAVPDRFYSAAMGLFKCGAVALLAYYVGVWTAGWGNLKINGGVAALILGIVFTELGFLDRNILNKCGCFNLTAFALMLYVFDGLKVATPALLLSVIGPMLLLIVIGVAGMCAVAFFTGKALKMSPFMAIASNLTALYGFPPNYVLTEEASKALAESPEEKEYLMGQMLPQMIVGGFVTVTITSVIIAGIFAGWF